MLSVSRVGGGRSFSGGRWCSIGLGVGLVEKGRLVLDLEAVWVVGARSFSVGLGRKLVEG